jgi:hypothetical protein
MHNYFLKCFLVIKILCHAILVGFWQSSLTALLRGFLGEW